MHYYDCAGTPETGDDRDFAYMENFLVSLRQDFLEFGGSQWQGAAGGCNYVARIVHHGGDPATRILKVPKRHERAQQLGLRERGMLKLLAATEPDCPVATPSLLREAEDPQRFVMTEVPGEVLRHGEVFSTQEQYLLGRDLGGVAIWESNIDRAAFCSTVEPHGGWNWPKLFAALDTFEDARYLATTAVVQEMITLRDAYFTDAAPETQVIHSDQRLANLAFGGSKGRRRLVGVFDWGAAQLGDIAHEARGLYFVGSEAVAGYNDELTAHNRPPASLDAVRFWGIGRSVLEMVFQLRDGIPSADLYMDARDKLVAEYPDRDWSELADINARLSFIDGEAGPLLGKGAFT